MVWCCFDEEPGRLAAIEETMNSGIYQKNLRDNATRVCGFFGKSIYYVWLYHIWVLQQDND